MAPASSRIVTELELFAACNRGCEPALEQELVALGATDCEVRRAGVAFRGDLRTAYAANLWLRSAIRVQELLLTADVDSAADLYEAVRPLPWHQWCGERNTLAVYASVTDAPHLKHSGYTALKVKDAVVDALRVSRGTRPDVDPHAPDLPLKLIVQGRRALLYRDLSGTSLHKRGWRPIQVKSPLSEATAAALLLMTDWDRRSPLVDPMCGSGTFPIEAAMLAAERAPGLGRTFAFERWPDHDRRLWNDLREEATARARPMLDFAIEGGDRHAGAIALAERGARAAGVERMVRFVRCDVRELRPRARPAIVVVNPPYGERIGRDQDLVDSWYGLGTFLREQCGGATAWVLSGTPELTRHLGLRASRRLPVMNGSIECRWLRYQLYSHRNHDPVLTT